LSIVPVVDSGTLVARSEDSRRQVREMQRRHLLEAMALMLGEMGFHDVKVAGLCARARVSPATFRELFGDLKSCFIALLEQVMEHSTALVIEAFEREARWEDGVLAGLQALLVFLDSEPQLARVCLVEALGGPQAALELRTRLLASLTPLLERGREQLTPERQPSSLTAPATIAAVAGILQEHLLQTPDSEFVELLGELSGLVVGAYLGVSEGRKQVERGNARSAALLKELRARPAKVSVSIPKELRHASAERMRSSLFYIAANPGASNQEVAQGIGLSHHGQMSNALLRLHDLGLLEKRAGGAGRPNAWRLSPYGEEVASAIDH
jgi:AcrR family transcriptional regulator